MLLNYFDHKKINSYGDRVLIKQTKWPFYLLNIKNKKSIWHSIQNQIEKLSENGDITFEDIDQFFDKYPEIEFEIDFFIQEMSEVFFFRIDGKMYCYTCEESVFEENFSKKIKARFYFDYEKILKIKD